MSDIITRNIAADSGDLTLNGGPGATVALPADATIGGSTPVSSIWREVSTFTVATPVANVDYTFDWVTYKGYYLEWVSVTPTGDGNALYARVSIDDGSTYEAGTNYNGHRTLSRASVSVSRTTSDQWLGIAGGSEPIGNAAGRGVSGFFRMQDWTVNNNSNPKEGHFQAAIYDTSGNPVYTWGSAAYRGTTTPTNLRLFFGVNTIETGTFVLRGLVR